MSQKTNQIIDIKPIVALGALCAILGLGSISGYAQANTALNLTISAGVLTMYAGDDNANNNDLCTLASDGATVESVACSAAERRATLTPLNVSSVRQITTSTIQDILFEDLRGLATATYSVTASMCNLTDGARVITLGANPDGAVTDTDIDAPLLAANGQLFASLNPSVGVIGVISPAAATAAFTADATLYARGAKTTVTSNATQVTVFNSRAATQMIPGRVNIDGVVLRHRIPAFVTSGTYACNMVFTVV